MALVREGLQNALDARFGDEKVLVRIFLSGTGNAASWDDVADLFDGAWDHLTSVGTGLNPDEVPQPGDQCPYLILEDLGTTGLEGDPAEAFQSRTGAGNHF